MSLLGMTSHNLSGDTHVIGRIGLLQCKSERSDSEKIELLLLMSGNYNVKDAANIASKVDKQDNGKLSATLIQEIEELKRKVSDLSSQLSDLKTVK